MKTSKYSQYFIDIDDTNYNITKIISEFIANIYIQIPNIKYSYVFFWQGVSEKAHKNIVEISKNLSFTMYTKRVKSKSDYVVKTDSHLNREVINMLLKSHTLNTLFVASKIPLDLDKYTNSNKNPITNFNLLNESLDFTIYIDLDWCINVKFCNEFISNEEVLNILKKYIEGNTAKIKVRENL